MTLESRPQRHPLIAYFALAYGISWGAILVVLAATGFDLANLRPLDTGLIFVLMLLGPSASGVTLTACLDGRAGLRRLWSSLARWRVGERWSGRRPLRSHCGCSWRLSWRDSCIIREHRFCRRHAAPLSIDREMRPHGAAIDQVRVGTRAEAGAPRHRSTLALFLLVFALSIPFWLIGTITDLQLTPGLSVSALMAFCPMAAALILRRRDSGSVA